MPTNERIPNDAPTQRTSDYVSYDSRTGKAQSTPMFHIAGYYKNISATLINCILSDVENVQSIYAEYMQEFQSMGQMNSIKALKSSDVVSNPIVQAEQVAKATKELTINAATIGTDSKSPKDMTTKEIKAELKQVKQELKEAQNAPKTIIEYLMRELNLTASESMQFKGDADAIAMYNKYVASLVPVKKELTFKELLAQRQSVPVVSSTPATEKTKQETAKLLKAAKKQSASTAKTLAAIETPKKKGIPVSFSVQIKGKEHEGIIEDNKTRAINNLVDKTLERTTIRNGETITEQKRITSVNRDTSSPSHYFDELVRQRYIFNVKELAQ